MNKPEVPTVAVAAAQLVVRDADGARVVNAIGLHEGLAEQRNRTRLLAQLGCDAALQAPECRELLRVDAITSRVREMHERFVLLATLDGKLDIQPAPDALERASMAESRGPATPWIDPLKEVQADAMAVEKGFADIDQIRIKRGAPASLIGAPAPQLAQPRPPAQLTLIDDDNEDAA